MKSISRKPRGAGLAMLAGSAATAGNGQDQEKEARTKKLQSGVQRLIWGLALLLPAVLGGCADSRQGGGPPAPTVTMTAPARAVTDVPINGSITATFNMPMAPATIDGGAFTLKPFSFLGLAGSVEGTVTLDQANNIATFTPANALEPNTSYTATITTGAKSLAHGVALEADYNWSFTTAPTPDLARPTVIFTDVYGTAGDTSGATGLPVNRASTVAFSETMNSASIAASFKLTGPGGAAVDGAVSYIGITATFTPAANLAFNTTYTSTVKTTAADLAGNTLAADYVWSWTTGSAPDLAAPRVTITNPANAAGNVPVYKSINAAFSEEMKQSTMITGNISLKETLSGNNVPGTVAYDFQNNVVSYLPQNSLTPDTDYTVTIGGGATDLAGNALVGGNVQNPWRFRTAATSAAPALTLTSPANALTAVPTDRSITATFSQPVAPSTIVSPATNFTLKRTADSAPVSGTVTLNSAGDVATFNPDGALEANTSYTATIGAGVKEQAAGTAMAADYSWSFITAQTTDATAPTLVATAAKNGDTGLSTNRVSTATFSEPMDPATINQTTFTVSRNGGPAVPGTVSYIGNTATFAPAGHLPPLSTYTSTITTGARDLAGNPIAADYVWSWSTGSDADDTAPKMTVSYPIHAAVNVPVGTTVNATFSEEMKQSTMIVGIFTVKETVSGSNVPGTVSYDVLTNAASFAPTGNLKLNTAYVATVGNGATDLAGNVLVSPAAAGDLPNPWSFTTGSLVQLGPNAVNLGSAGNFNVLSGSDVNNIDTVANPTSIDGLVGVYPGSAVTGLPNAVVPVGQIHAGDTVAQAAKADLLAAYNDAASRSVNAISLPGNLGGLTLAPGLYVNETSSGISGTGPNAILTLNALGDANAIWIFKMGSTLTTDSGTSVVLAGGAQAKNVFWQVGSSATLGTNSIFKGNVLAQISITLTTGANLQGRALTQTGAVTLDKNTIALP